MGRAWVVPWEAASLYSLLHAGLQVWSLFCWAWCLTHIALKTTSLNSCHHITNVAALQIRYTATVAVCLHPSLTSLTNGGLQTYHHIASKMLLPWCQGQRRPWPERLLQWFFQLRPAWTEHSTGEQILGRKRHQFCQVLSFTIWPL